MERVIILKNTVTEQELTMPVTPSRYPMAAGRAVERLDMAQTGQIALPGLKSLFNESLEVMLPAQVYPFCTSGAVADPRYYLDLLVAWSDAGDVCRYIVSGTNINAAVLLGPVSYEERDGTNDVYATIPLYEYRYLEEVVVETTQNAGRPPASASQKQSADSYVVQKGDSLSSICKKIYGDSSLAYKLATANGIKNPNIIQVGQVLQLPAKSTLSTLTATAAPAAADVSVEEVKETLMDAIAAARKTMYLRSRGVIT